MMSLTANNIVKAMQKIRDNNKNDIGAQCLEMQKFISRIDLKKISKSTEHQALTKELSKFLYQILCDINKYPSRPISNLTQALQTKIYELNNALQSAKKAPIIFTDVIKEYRISLQTSPMSVPHNTTSFNHPRC